MLRPSQFVLLALVVECTVQLVQIPPEPITGTRFGQARLSHLDHGAGEEVFGDRPSQRSMNRAYWHEVSPRRPSLETAPPQSG